jgi:HK97 family phage prohead protease
LTQYVTTDYFKTKQAPTAEHIVVRKDTPAPVEAVENEPRQLRFVISTGSVDRDYDMISTRGWELDSFRKNSVVLWSHDQKNLPIGRVVDIGVEGNALKATIDFVPADIPEVGPKADAIFKLCQQGFLSATSVGFVPLEYELSSRMSPSGKPGLDITSALLCELSLVNLPSNPDALIEARSFAEQKQKAIEQKLLMEKRNLRARRARRAILIGT